MRLGATASRGAVTIADADFRRIAGAIVFRRAETIAFRRATTIEIRGDAGDLIPIGATGLFGETDRIRAEAVFRRIVRAGVFRRATTIEIRGDAVGLIPIGEIDLSGETDRIRADADFRRIVRAVVFRRAETVAFRRVETTGAATIGIRVGEVGLIPTGEIDLFGETDRIREDADFRRIVRAVVFRRVEADAFRRVEIIAFRRAATIGIRADAVDLIPIGEIDLSGETGRIRADADFRRIVRAVVFRRAETIAFHRAGTVAFRRVETIGATTIGIRGGGVSLIPIGAIDLFGETDRIRGDADFRRIVRAVAFRRAETVAFRRAETIAFRRVGTIGAMTIGIRAGVVGLIPIGAIVLSGEIDLSEEIDRIRGNAAFRRIVRAVVFRRAETIAFRRATTIEIRADAVGMIPIEEIAPSEEIDLSTTNGRIRAGAIFRIPKKETGLIRKAMKNRRNCKSFLRAPVAARGARWRRRLPPGGFLSTARRRRKGCACAAPILFNWTSARCFRCRTRRGFCCITNRPARRCRGASARRRRCFTICRR